MTATTPYLHPPIDEVGDELCSLAGQITAATGRFLALLADFDTREGWGGAGVLSCAHWLSWRCGIDLRTARDHVRVARALVALPRTTTELAAGRLSYSKVRAVTRVATPTTEDELVDIALTAPAAHVERLVRGLRAVDRQQERERGDEPAPRQHVQHRWDEETGHLVLWGRLCAQDGALVLAALTRAEHERTRTDRAADGPAEPTDLTGGPPSDLGPALVAMAELTCAAAAAPAGAPAAEVVVHLGPHGPQLERGPALSEEAAEEVACGSMRRDVVVENGCVLSFGRRRRRPSPVQLRALHLRDGGCRAPGCGRTRFLHAHHVVALSRGGTTDLDNLVLLCGGCHRSLHLHQFTISANGEQRFTFYRHGEVWLTAPPMAGDDAGRFRGTVDPHAIGGSWNGDALDVGYATSVLRQGRELPPAA